MSHSTNKNVPSLKTIKTETRDKAKTENKAETESSDETVERVCDSDQDEYFLVPKSKTKPKAQIQLQTQTKTETRSKDVLPYWFCGETFKNDTALKTLDE